MDDRVAQLGIVRRWLPLLVIGILLTAGPVYLYATSRQHTFKASARLVVDVGAAPSTDDYAVAEHLATDWARQAGTRTFAHTVIARLGLAIDTEAFSRQVTTSAPLGSREIVIEASAPDADLAAAIANGVLDTLVDEAAARTSNPDLEPVAGYLAATRTEVDRLQERMDALLALVSLTPAQQVDLATMTTRMDALRATYVNLLRAAGEEAVRPLNVLDRAVPPLDPNEPRPWMLALLAGAVGAVVAATVAFVVEYLDDSLSDVVEVERATGLPVMGVITEHRRDTSTGGGRRLPTVSDPASGLAEAYRDLRANVDVATAGREHVALLVAPAERSAASEVIASNLAASFALVGKRVVLMDADLRRPAVHSVFLIPNEDGLATLIERPTVGLASVVRSVVPAALHVVTAGSGEANPADLLASPGMAAAVHEAVARSDVLIVSGPPLSGPSDGITIAPLLGLTLLVLPAGISRARAQQALDRTAVTGVRIVGICILRRTRRARRVARLQVPVTA